MISNSDPPEAIICDFGTSRIIEASLELGRPSLREKGTVRWLAYELILGIGSNEHSKETDIWAFGMTIYVSSRLHFLTRPKRSPLQGTFVSEVAVLSTQPGAASYKGNRRR